MGSKYSRRRLWIDPGLQFRLLFRIALYLLAYAFIVVHLAFGCEALLALLSDQAVKGDTIFYFQFLSQYRFFLFGVVLLLPWLLYDMLKFSHRVAGPLYRCRKTMLEMAEGKPVPEFQPRKYDLMPELFQAFNALIKEHNSRIPAGAASQLGNTCHHNGSPKEPSTAV